MMQFFTLPILKYGLPFGCTKKSVWLLAAVCMFSTVVFAQPTITSFSPASAKPGDAVTITGTNFNTTAANNIVYFGATKATVTGATSTSMTATVPVSATYAPITVLNTSTSLVAFSRVNFNPIYSPVKNAITSTDFPNAVRIAYTSNQITTAVGDMDGDGKPDLVVVNSSDTVFVYRNTASTGSFGTGNLATVVKLLLPAGGTSLAVSDLDGDGKLDVVVLSYSGLCLFRNTSINGNLSFEARADYYVAFGPYGMAIGDFDGDGKPDLAMGSLFQTQVTVFRNITTSGSFTASSFASPYYINVGYEPYNIAVADMDGDGKHDVVSMHSTLIGIARSTSSPGTVSFAPIASFSFGGYPNAFTIGDLDGDGKQDLIVANGSNYTSIIRNTSTSGTINGSSFAAPVNFATNPSIGTMTVGDLDGDGKPDVLIGDYLDYSVSILRNTNASSGSITSGSFAPIVSIANNVSNTSLSICDMDGDQWPDIIGGYSPGTGQGEVAILRSVEDNTVWNGSTWSNGTPSTILNAFIGSNTAPSSFTCNTLTINSGYSLASTGITATVHGDVTNNGNGIAGTGNLVIAANGALAGTALSFGGKLTVSGGATLTTNDKLTLTSDATNTGSIGNSAGTISGNVTVQRYIPSGRRAYRFLAHPFSSNIAMSSLTDNIDVTGSGGSPFTTTGTNSPSAYYYNNTVANSSLTTDPGWTALIASSTLNSKTAYRVLVRGSKGQTNSLNGGSYTPAAVTLDWTGALNQGNQIFTLTNGGTNKAYNFIGNPYACPVDMSLITRGSNINANFSVWNPSASTKGAYVTQAFSSSYILPSGSAFFTQSGANTNNTITFTEASKSAGSPSSLFRGNNGKEDELTIKVTDMNDQYADQLTFYFSNTDKAYTKRTDVLWDAEKLLNPEINLYSYSMNGDRLAIDRRPIHTNDTIQLGFTQIPQSSTYKFNIEQKGRANTNGIQLYLRDKWKHTETLLNDQLQVLVEVAVNDAASYGANRFELVAKKAPVLTSITNSFSVSIGQNPTRDMVKVSFSNEAVAATFISVTNAAGKQVRIVQAGNVQSGQVNIDVKGLARGIYFVTLDNGTSRRTEKLLVD